MLFNIGPDFYEEQEERFGLMLHEYYENNPPLSVDRPKETPCLRPLERGFDIPKTLSFDVETAGRKNKFVLGSVHQFYHNQDVVTEFLDRDKMKEFLLSPQFSARKCWIFATNLMFDYSCLFDDEEMRYSELCFRGSSLIMVKHRTQKKGGNAWKFLDSLNYGGLSVKKMGQIIGIPKMLKPRVGRCSKHQTCSDESMIDKCAECRTTVWRRPTNQQEENELRAYNVNDSIITNYFIRFFFKTLKSVNVQPKITIASCAINGWRRNGLDKKIYQASRETILDSYLTLAGGRVEAIKRGPMPEGYNYYDVNSLYPFMCSTVRLPNPNKYRIATDGARYYRQYEGISKVIISSPETHIPYLHYKTGAKLLFPILKEKTVWYTNLELREAEKRGYTVHKVLKSHYFFEAEIFFKKYIQRMYDLRQSFKAQGNPAEYVVKLLLNSPWGKTCQRFYEKEKWVYKEDFDMQMYEEWGAPDKPSPGAFIKLSKDSLDKIPAFVQPYWGAYITAAARLELYNLIEHAEDVAYYDTDSIITTSKLPTSDDMGCLKREMRVLRGIIVRPKFYALASADSDKCFVKVKGLDARLQYNEFEGFVKNPIRSIQKFMKMREAWRRGMACNEILNFDKEFKTDDEKRLWPGRFRPDKWQSSKAVRL